MSIRIAHQAQLCLSSSLCKEGEQRQGRRLMQPRTTRRKGATSRPHLCTVGADVKPAPTVHRETIVPKTRFLLISETDKSIWCEVLKQAVTPLGTLEIVTEKEVREHEMGKHYDPILIDAISVGKYPRLIEYIRKRWPEARPIVVTASPRWEVARDAFRTGAADYINKSMNPGELRSALRPIIGR